MKLLSKFDMYANFLTKRSGDDEKAVQELFNAIADEFENMREEKLTYPNNFVRDLRLYKNKNSQIVEYFEDVEKKYLLLSDLYDYLKITKRL